VKPDVECQRAVGGRKAILGTRREKLFYVTQPEGRFILYHTPEVSTNPVLELSIEAMNWKGFVVQKRDDSSIV